MIYRVTIRKKVLWFWRVIQVHNFRYSRNWTKWHSEYIQGLLTVEEIRQFFNGYPEDLQISMKRMGV